MNVAKTKITTVEKQNEVFENGYQSTKYDHRISPIFLVSRRFHSADQQIRLRNKNISAIVF